MLLCSLSQRGQLLVAELLAGPGCLEAGAVALQQNRCGLPRADRSGVFCWESPSPRRARSAPWGRISNPAAPARGRTGCFSSSLSSSSEVPTCLPGVPSFAASPALAQRPWCYHVHRDLSTPSCLGPSSGSAFHSPSAQASGFSASPCPARLWRQVPSPRPLAHPLPAPSHTALLFSPKRFPPPDARGPGCHLAPAERGLLPAPIPASPRQPPARGARRDGPAPGRAHRQRAAPAGRAGAAGASDALAQGPESPRAAWSTPSLTDAPQGREELQEPWTLAGRFLPAWGRAGRPRGSRCGRPGPGWARASPVLQAHV